MLGALRRHRNSPVITVLLALTAIVMIGFGVSFRSGPGGLYAAEVNGEVITDPEYAVVYANAYRQRQQQDPKYNKDSAKRDKLRENVLYGLILTKILAQKARDRGLAVDEEMLRDEILEDPRFQKDGRFSKDLYERWMSMLGTSDTRFEESQREQILSGIMLAAVENMGVSDREVRDQFAKEQTKVNVEFVQIPKAAYAADVGTVTPADQKEWAARPAAEEEITKYYTRFKNSRYDVPKKVCAQHILVRSPKGQPPDLVKEAQQKIEKAAVALKGGMSFEKAALEFSDDSNKAKGGDLGCFSTGQMLPQVEEAAFGLKPGEISNVLETPFGYQILRVTEIKEPVRKKLEEVRDEIIGELVREQKAGVVAKKRADEVQKLAAEKPSLAEAVAALAPDGKDAPKVEETGPFPEGREFIPRLGPAKAVSAAAWRLTPEKPVGDAPVETDTAWVILRLKAKTAPTDEEFEQQKLGLTYSLITAKQSLLFEGWSTAMREAEDVSIHPVALTYDDRERSDARDPRN
jgi:peptidyl-prolyl cis-trans isomerase D